MRLAARRARPRGDAPRIALPRWQTALRATTITLAALLILVLGGIVYFAFEIPIDGGTTSDAQGALTVDAADGSVLAARGTAHGEQLGYEEIAPVLRKAIVAGRGSPLLLARGGRPARHAARHRPRHGARHAQGASTITQQLARLMLLSNERTLRRKMQEALVAVWLEHHLDKKEILARYLDTAYFGAGAYGADAAAQRYFGRSARDLTLAQAAMIAGLVRAPSALAPVKNLEGAQARAGVVLHAMAETGAITKAEADAAVASPAVLEVPPDLPPGPGYVADAAQADIKSLVGGGALDLTARTTIDAKLQAAAEASVETHLAGEGARKHATHSTDRSPSRCAVPVRPETESTDGSCWASARRIDSPVLIARVAIERPYFWRGFLIASRSTLRALATKGSLSALSRRRRKPRSARVTRSASSTTAFSASSADDARTTRRIPSTRPRAPGLLRVLRVHRGLGARRERHRWRRRAKLGRQLGTQLVVEPGRRFLVRTRGGRRAFLPVARGQARVDAGEQPSLAADRGPFQCQPAEPYRLVTAALVGREQRGELRASRREIAPTRFPDLRFEAAPPARGPARARSAAARRRGAPARPRSARAAHRQRR